MSTVLRFLSDSELARLNAAHPEIASGICPTCHDTGTYRWWGDDHACNCQEQKQLNKLYSHAGIGLKYQRLTWDDLTLSDKQLAPIHDYVNNPEDFISRGIGFFITGTIGTGKTLIANLMLKELVKKAYDCYFTTTSQTIESFTSTWGSQENKVIFAERFMLSRVLCLDDLGKEFRGNGKLPQSTFDHILRTRTQNLRPSIITSNLSPNEVRTGYGAAVLSLLLEQSIGMHLVNSDFRPKAHDRTMSERDKGEKRPIV